MFCFLVQPRATEFAVYTNIVYIVYIVNSTMHYDYMVKAYTQEDSHEKFFISTGVY